MSNASEKPLSGNPEPNDVLFLGGNDLEMYQIEKRARQKGVRTVSKGLDWEHAVVDAYQAEMEEVFAEGNIPVAIELRGADTVKDYKDIEALCNKFHIDMPEEFMHLKELR